ncbi:MAG: sugar transferase [Rubrivivax sp.]|nr:sugar transferase [Rubrivivax sp.]
MRNSWWPTGRSPPRRARFRCSGACASTRRHCAWTCAWSTVPTRGCACCRHRSLRCARRRPRCRRAETRHLEFRPRLALRAGAATPLLKRLFDLALVLATLPLWLPLVALVALSVRWRLGAPVLFRQPRVGQHGRIFELLKFRSMTGERDDSGRLLPDAERLPPFGRWLRSTSLDELPSFLNVLRGQMSLVGPRPLLVEYLPLYTPRQARRHDVPPGLTGWAQVNGRNAQSWEQRFEHDVWYVEHRSFALDLRILALTVAKVLRREGVCAAGQATMEPFRGSPSR